MIFAQFPVKKEQLKINFISINTINGQDFKELYLEILNEFSTKIWSVRGRYLKDKSSKSAKCSQDFAM